MVGSDEIASGDSGYFISRRFLAATVDNLLSDGTAARNSIMITSMESKETTNGAEKCLDPQLWHACAGGMVQIPPLDTKVFYFPQGHAEHASGPVDFRTCPRLPPFVACRVSAVKFMADLETDEVYSKIKLVPLNRSELDFEEDRNCGINGGEVHDKHTSFAKTLTQSDANNGGGFSVPRYCAETIFPRLDHNVDPPVQNILAKDVHGAIWKFRHIYRGTPRRHLLTTGWSTFVNHKKLVAGDSIVFLRAQNGELCVGIRRAKRGIGGGPESSCGWNALGEYGGYSGFSREKLSSDGNGKVRPESVFEAAVLAANAQPFEVTYYPRASTPEFCVKVSSVRAAMQIRWGSGMRFKMPFETEDSSRISWFMGTISSVQVADPICWPDSPWRLLQVTWDEPDLLQNVKRVSPWLVELVSNISSINLSPFQSSRKRPRFQPQPEFPFDATQFPIPTSFSNNNHFGPSFPFGCLLDKTSPAGMQGARHALYKQSFSGLRFDKFHASQFPVPYPPFDHKSALPARAIIQKPSTMSNEVAGLLTMGCLKKSDGLKQPQLVLFGQTILTEQQMSKSPSETVSPGMTGNSLSDGNVDKLGSLSDESVENGHCKVFMESEDVGRTIDLSLLGSYDELCRKLADLFGIENSETLNHVLYRDGSGAIKHIGDEPFRFVPHSTLCFSNFGNHNLRYRCSEFMKSRRVTILMDSGSGIAGI